MENENLEVYKIGLSGWYSDSGKNILPNIPDCREILDYLFNTAFQLSLESNINSANGCNSE
jgi:hypothetical protein